MSSERDTLHDFSIDVARTMAEVFGLEVDTNPASQQGPDIIMRHPRPLGDDYDAVMYVESEIGHDAGGAEAYFHRVAKRLELLIPQDKANKRTIAITIITNAPRRLSSYLERKSTALTEKFGFKLIEGWSIYIVPALLFREMLPAILVRTFGAVGRTA